MNRKMNKVDRKIVEKTNGTINETAETNKKPKKKQIRGQLGQKQ